jgi:TPR repeat protein
MLKGVQYQSNNINLGCLIESSIYLNGDRKIKDLKKGVKSLKKACQLKEAYTCIHLGIAYINANYGLKRDEKKAKIYLKKACSFRLKDACI